MIFLEGMLAFHGIFQYHIRVRNSLEEGCSVTKTGVIHGRFQMLHIGHMEYLLEGKNRCDYLVIGITNPDPTLTRFSPANPHRSSTLTNPLTYFQRMQIITGAMLEAGVPRDEFDIIPFPINRPELLFFYSPKDVPYFMTIYDEWGYEKKATLEKLGCLVKVMWKRPNDQKVTSGSEIRDLIGKNEEWSHLVPPFVYRYVVDNGIDVEIRKIRQT